MPERRSFFGKPRSEVVQMPTSFVASARQIKTRSKDIIKAHRQITQEKWQEQAWRFYDIVPEFRFGCNWVGNALSRARLYIDVDGEEQKSGPAVDILNAVYGGPENHSEMLRLLGIHFTVAGEAYIAGQALAADEVDWSTVGRASISLKGETYSIDDEVLSSESFLLRLWRPHPAKKRAPDAPARALLPTLSELDKLGQHVAATLDSRLASAGVLLVPTEIEFSRGNTQREKDGELVSAQSESVAQDLMQEFADVAAEALADRESAEALVPLVLQMPGEFIDKVKHLMFSTPLDEKVKEHREEDIARLALGMDMPPEALTGTGELNHWNAWAVDESAIKSHTEPLLDLLTASLTKGLLRPLLLADGMSVDQAAKVTIKADTTEIRLRPNRSKEAVELYDRGALKRSTMLSEVGFDPDKDAPDDTEFSQWLLAKTAQGSPTPELVAKALQMLGVIDEIPELDPADKSVNQAPSLLEHPVREIPEADAALMAASHVLVLRALERAGNRIKTRFGLKGTGNMAAELYLHAPDLSAADVDFLLEDAWSTVGDIAAAHRVKNPEALRSALDNYTRVLVQSRRPLKLSDLTIYVRSHLKAKDAA